MRINNNMMAINAHRQLGVTNNASAKTLEKLSSGLRINRAGDDAAGLAISEKMRGQIRGLNMASKNAQDGISLIQTAEGALTETHAILQRMRELAVQSANDTNVEVDRGEIQKEIDQLAAEITRISETTQFNTQDLLTGEFSAKFHIGANSGQNVDLAINDMSAKALNVQGVAYKATEVQGATNIEVTSKTGETLSIEFAALKTGDGHEAVTDTTADFDEENNKIIIKLKQAAYDTASSKDGAIEATEADIKAALDTVASEAGISVAVKDGATLGTDALTSKPDATTVNVTVIDEDASKKVGIDVSSQTKADTSITTINKAIEQVSAERSKLGAMQNRLEHSIKNLDTSAENLQAAESRIRDVDYAEAA
ncbi:flagellin N-terminal helical domain-containing protein [Xylanivirga thermophila]|uniref:flagellin N-terminal helical domain-containing protein n=1 Tax=Xylanivirga thermophila TaxID=2496273 RepID=UPI00101CD2B6|nr:flagellin [Xylanivirga thermophila]